MKLNKECKYFNNCPFKTNGVRDCEREFKLVYGKNWKNKDATILWSIKVCYALKDLIDKGLVELNGNKVCLKEMNKNES